MNTAELERAVCGALLRDNALIATVELYHVTGDAFTVPVFRQIFESISAELRTGGAADAVIVAAKLPGREIEIAECYAAVCTTALFPEWLAALKNAEAKRQIVQSCRAAIAEAEKPDADAKRICGDLEAGIEFSRLTSGGNHLPGLDEAARAVIRDLVKNPPPVIPFFPSNTEAARKVRMHPGELFVLGARTGSGKTALCAAAAWEQLLAGWNVAYFCTESNTAAILARIAAAASGIPHYVPDRTPDRLRQFEKVVETIARDFGKRLHIVGNDGGAITPGTVRRKLREIEQDGAAQVVYLDFLQNMKADRRERSALEEINATVQAVHDTLAEYGAAGIVVSQFNRASQSNADTGKGGALPNLTWLKDTSSLEQLAHTVAFLYTGANGQTCLYSGKTRNCAPFSVSLQWDGVKYVSADAVTGEYI